MVAPPDGALRILVVDDEASVLRQLVDGLKIYGHDAIGASSATEAQDLLSADPLIGAVLTDIRMPGLDGMTLAQRILQQRTAADAVEVVVMTGHATVDDAAAAVRTRVSDFLRKPFRLTDASQAMKSAVERARARRLAAAEQNTLASQLRSLEQQRNALLREAEDTSRRLARSAPPPDAVHKLERDMHAISHALRTPLIAIAGGADLLGAPTAGNEAAEYLSILRDGVRQAREAVELVEELQQVERTPHVTDRALLDLAGIAARTRRQMLPAAAERRISIAAPAMTPVTVRGDQARLPRAVELCLGAALDWAQPGALIELRAEAKAGAAGDWAMLTVAVSPPGAAPAASLPNDLVFPETGSIWSRTQEGLRFSIARRIAEQHGGRLTSWNGGDGLMALRLSLPL